MPKNTEVKSNRDRYMERLKTKYPDKEFADDEALFGQTNDDYDSYDNELSGYREREKALSDLFASNPRSAAFLTDWRKGEDPIIGMVRKFGDDFKAALEDPEKQEALAAANKEFAERIAQEKEYEGEYQKNLNETLTTLETMQQDEDYLMRTLTVQWISLSALCVTESWASSHVRAWQWHSKPSGMTAMWNRQTEKAK